MYTSLPKAAAVKTPEAACPFRIRVLDGGKPCGGVGAALPNLPCTLLLHNPGTFTCPHVHLNTSPRGVAAGQMPQDPIVQGRGPNIVATGHRRQREPSEL